MTFSNRNGNAAKAKLQATVSKRDVVDHCRCKTCGQRVPTVYFYASNKRMPAFPGLFVYGGLGVGQYYDKDLRCESMGLTEAKEKAKKEGLAVTYVDSFAFNRHGTPLDPALRSTVFEVIDDE